MISLVWYDLGLDSFFVIVSGVYPGVNYSEGVYKYVFTLRRHVYMCYTNLWMPGKCSGSE